MKIFNAFPSKYLKATDLQEREIENQLKDFFKE